VGTFSSNFGRLAYELQLAWRTDEEGAGSAAQSGQGWGGLDAARHKASTRGTGSVGDSVGEGARPAPVSLDFPWYADP